MTVFKKKIKISSHIAGDRYQNPMSPLNSALKNNVTRICYQHKSKIVNIIKRKYEGSGIKTSFYSELVDNYFVKSWKGTFFSHPIWFCDYQILWRYFESILRLSKEASDFVE